MNLKIWKKCTESILNYYENEINSEKYLRGHLKKSGSLYRKKIKYVLLYMLLYMLYKNNTN